MDLESGTHMKGWLAIIRPFRTMSRWLWKAVCSGTPFTIEKIYALGAARTRDR